MFFAGTLVGLFGGDCSRVGATMALIHAPGMIAIWFAPDTTNKSLGRTYAESLRDYEGRVR